MLLYSGRHLVHYGQIALLDAEDKSSYPNPVGPLPWIGPKGIVVPAKTDEWVQVLVGAGTAADLADRPVTFLTRTTIAVGKRGLLVGNITTASTAEIDWPAGRTTVSAFHAGDSLRDADYIVFALEHDLQR